MPHATTPTPEPAPDRDDAVDPVSPQPVHYAEQALLGALLLQPHRLEELGDMEPEQFADAAHRALFTALRATPPPDAEKHARDATWLNVVLTAARATMPTLTPGYPHQLVQACPWPRHLHAYARIVQGEHARRRLRAAAARLVRRAGDASLPHPVPAVLAEADVLAALVDDVAARFPARAGTLPRLPAPRPALTPGLEAAEEEQLVLATATARPGDIASVRWLLPEDFTHPLHAG
ncbi:DnaB-like helicase N-terminal domain-containing protein, partial [Streptomyces sp. UH6]|uniref:DnaB-like helicase N-terminal domain-containing protein n=1 Tax=Streptomyces sp. UH6 TaxID=2748379 RepID=UPI0017D76DC8